MERETKQSPANKQQAGGWAVSLGTDQCVPRRCGKTGQRRQGQSMAPYYFKYKYIVPGSHTRDHA